MEIIKANETHEEMVLHLLDQFRDFVAEVMGTKKEESTSARNKGGPLFENAIKSDKSIILLAKDKDRYVGIMSLFIVPQIRKGTTYAEVEEMFVVRDYQGTEAARLLVDKAVEWARKKGVNSIRLESSNELTRAHTFYKKVGFKEYGKAFEKNL